MKKRCVLMAVLFILLLTAGSALADRIPVQSIELPEQMTGSINKTVTLKAAVTPGNAANKKLVWSSSDESVATVNPSGVVKCLSEG